ncbi:MAG TPA: hypothetical protein VJ772_03845 [Nitrososphaeraceae archaeon]|jgi:hypothetical protein|nr:hypothetical protein [Nitrososphaeraceae archaeon]
MDPLDSELRILIGYCMKLVVAKLESWNLDLGEHRKTRLKPTLAPATWMIRFITKFS